MEVAEALEDEEEVRDMSVILSVGVRVLLCGEAMVLDLFWWMRVC